MIDTIASLPHAVVVHGLADAMRAVDVGAPVTLLSARGAALSLGCLWWRELVTAAQAARLASHPNLPLSDILDCADSPGRAMAALRAGQRLLALDATVPAYAAVASAAERLGAQVVAERPPALDLGDPRAARELRRWLMGSV